MDLTTITARSLLTRRVVKRVVLAGLLLTGLHGQAQTYEPGLLVRSTGDTLRGELENSFWTEPPAFIRYRTGPDSPSQLFQPRQLRAVSFTNGRYFRYEALPIDHAAENRVEYLHRGNSPNIRIDSLLAEVLVEGPASLLRVGRLSGAHYLVLGAGQPVLDLSAQQYLRKTPTGAWQRTDGNNYRGLLGLFFADCPTAFTAIQSAPFTPAGLAAVVQAYNQSCSPAQRPGRIWLTQAKLTPQLALQGGVLAGLRYNRVESTSEMPIGLVTGACVDCQAHPYAGLYAELLQPGRTGALYGELSLSPFTGAGMESLYVNGTAYFVEYRYRALLGTARLAFRHFFRLPREQQLVLGLGYELNRVLSPSVTSSAGPPANLRQVIGYAYPTLFPNVALGWRSHRTTLSLDGQMYADSRAARRNAGTVPSGAAGDFFASSFFGSNFALRVGVAYRLGANPDQTRSNPAEGRP